MVIRDESLPALDNYSLFFSLFFFQNLKKRPRNTYICWGKWYVDEVMTGFSTIPFFTFVTFTFEVLLAVVASVSLRYAYHVAKKYDPFTKKGWKEILIGILLIIFHLVLDAVDTIVYEFESEPKIMYSSIDNVEALLSVIGTIALIIGMSRFSIYLMELWQKPESSS